MHLPSHEYLDKLDIPYEKAGFSPDIEKGAASVALAPEVELTYPNQ
jgi:hypothetical protein